MKTLVVTNDFPPRRGGIETFVFALTNRLRADGAPSGPDDVVVLTATMPGDTETDHELPYRVVRVPGEPFAPHTLLPTPAVREAAVQVFHDEGCDRVLIGSSVPLGLLAPALRAAGARRIVALTHGHEVWWSKLPGPDLVLRHVADSVDALADLSDWTRRRIAPALSAAGRARQRRVAPGVDTNVFYPGVGDGPDGRKIARVEHGIPDAAPLVVTCSRLVRRKGQDMLIAAWPQVLATVPDARLVIVGDGPDRKRLEELVAEAGVGDSVIFTGAVPDVAVWMDAADVFAMPSRTRLGGLEVEGLGIVFLEAAACGKPVIVGRSGGAPEAVLDGESGFVVNPRDPAEIARRLVELLSDPARAQQMGRRGREWVVQNWQWDTMGAHCRELLAITT